jgi:hypothetical protein
MLLGVGAGGSEASEGKGRVCSNSVFNGDYQLELYHACGWRPQDSVYKGDKQLQMNIVGHLGLWANGSLCHVTFLQQSYGGEFQLIIGIGADA